MAGIKPVPGAQPTTMEKEDISNIERVMSPEMEKDFMNYDRVDAEVAKCR